MNKLNLVYITYQYFPDETANSIQSISTIKYFIRNGFKVKLIFPNRKKKVFTANDIKDFYDIKENFDIEIKNHRFPFGKVNFLNKYFFYLSHFLWSFVNTFLIKEKNETIFFTRSDWVFFFLSMKNIPVIFECHQYTRTRNFVISRMKNKKRSYIIFTSPLLKSKFKLKSDHQNNIILHNGFDSDYFMHINKKEPKKVVFVGNLTRFNKSRGIDFLINSFESSELENFKLFLIGGPKSESDRIKKHIDEKGVNNIFVKGYLNHMESIEEMKTSEIGILINNDDDHSKFYTSPLKYFEYMAANLKVIAVNYPSHRNLPESENIVYFEKDDTTDFINSILNSTKKDYIHKDLNEFTLDKRIKKIISFVARLEGFEPPTL